MFRQTDEVRRREEQACHEIESGDGACESGIGGYQSLLESGQADEKTSVSKLYEQIFGGLTDQKTSNFSKLEAERDEVNSRQAQSIKDLHQNLSNVHRDATIQFGTMGAGDTSAIRAMLPYTYTKIAGALEGSIRNRSNHEILIRIAGGGKQLDSKIF